MSLLVENGTVLTAGKAPTVLPNHSVLIEHGWITQVAPKSQFKRFAGKRIDASRKVVVPGFINAHTHFYSTFARGLTTTKPAGNFVDVLKNLWWRLDSALTIEDCYYSALIALLDAIRHGTTTLIDHHASPHAVRGSLRPSRGPWKSPACAPACAMNSPIATAPASPKRAWRKTSPSSAAASGAAFRRWLSSAPKTVQSRRRTARPTTGTSRPQPTVAALFGLHAAFTLKDATLEKAAALGQELGTGFHIHVAEPGAISNTPSRSTACGWWSG